MVFERHHSALIAASVITVASFVAATAYTQDRLARLDALSSSLETNAIPSIDYLSRASVRLARLNQLVDQVASGEQPATTRTAALEERRALENDISEYVRLSPLPGERDFWDALRSDVNRAVTLVQLAVDPQPGHDVPDRDDVDEALDDATRSVLTTLDFDVQQSKAMARDVRGVRATTFREIVTLNAVATAIAAFGVFVAYRASRRHDQLLQDHSSLLDARVTELDRFAGRVAHDVLSPLGTVAIGLSLLARSCDAHGRSYVERSQRALQRVQQLVEGLLMFARSGAQPDAGFRCAIDAVVASVIGDSSDSAAEKGIELIVEPGASADVPCAVGVMTSIVQNLVRNAIKYMGAGPVRRIVVRTRAIGPMVRLEVEDSGPGIAPEHHAMIFDPFVRGPHEAATGTGLGLATVRRLVESHGGRIGVRSSPGAGSLFWVELMTVRDGGAAAPATSTDRQPG